MEDNSQVVCLSLGATRDFILCDKSNAGEYERDQLRIEKEFKVGHGDLFCLGQETNNQFCHAVPRDPSVTQPRISIIFRTIDKSFIDFGEGESVIVTEKVRDTVTATVTETSNDQVTVDNSYDNNNSDSSEIVHPKVEEKMALYANGKQKMIKAHCILCKTVGDPGTREHISDLINTREAAKIDRVLSDSSSPGSSPNVDNNTVTIPNTTLLLSTTINGNTNDSNSYSNNQSDSNTVTDMNPNDFYYQYISKNLQEIREGIDEDKSFHLSYRPDTFIVNGAGDNSYFEKRDITMMSNYDQAQDRKYFEKAKNEMKKSKAVESAVEKAARQAARLLKLERTIAEKKAKKAIEKSIVNEIHPNSSSTSTDNSDNSAKAAITINSNSHSDGNCNSNSNGDSNGNCHGDSKNSKTNYEPSLGKIKEYYMGECDTVPKVSIESSTVNSDKSGLPQQ